MHPIVGEYQVLRYHGFDRTAASGVERNAAVTLVPAVADVDLVFAGGLVIEPDVTRIFVDRTWLQNGGAVKEWARSGELADRERGESSPDHWINTSHRS